MAEYRTMRAQGIATSAAEIDQGLRAHMNKVYATMSIGLLVTFATAWAFGSNPALLQVLRDPATLQPTILGWIVMFAPLGMVFAFGAIITRASAAAAQLFFYVFSAVMGASIAYIFAVFTGASIVQAFLVTSIAFASLSLFGYVTKRDISGWGAFLMMGLIGGIVLMILSLVMSAFFGIVIPGFDIALSLLLLLVFAGLTAYHTQAIKQEYVDHAQYGDSEWLAKSAIMGALNLYMSFINMFMIILSFLGNRE
ncbi:BAX inhibitor (BI)-1/YccA family protein [Rhodobacterales bacterium HKCCE4037]|nr:BAX inhibitor (BI)-1/YccA family protein [Rhodobacterales bacterium HKCCE4037]